MSDEDKCCDVCGQWHQSHDDLICTLYSYLEQKDARIKELEEREKKLMECVKFYADGIKAKIASSDYPYCSDYDYAAEGEFFHYGKLARQTLKELGIKDKE